MQSNPLRTYQCHTTLVMGEDLPYASRQAKAGTIIVSNIFGHKNGSLNKTGALTEAIY